MPKISKACKIKQYPFDLGYPPHILCLAWNQLNSTHGPSIGTSLQILYDIIKGTAYWYV